MLEEWETFSVMTINPLILCYSEITFQISILAVSFSDFPATECLRFRIGYCGSKVERT
jgi:hypothetical protein